MKTDNVKAPSYFAEESPQLKRSRMKFAEELKREKTEYSEEEKTRKLQQIKKIMKEKIDKASEKREVLPSKRSFRHFTEGEDVEIQSSKITAFAKELAAKLNLDGKGSIG